MNSLHIAKGKAIITADGLRCRAARVKDPSQVCNKLIVKKNSSGQLAGSFKCERCNQEIDEEIHKMPTPSVALTSSDVFQDAEGNALANGYIKLILSGDAKVTGGFVVGGVGIT